jgi:hypothetical protein
VAKVKMDDIIVGVLPFMTARTDRARADGDLPGSCWFRCAS